MKPNNSLSDFLILYGQTPIKKSYIHSSSDYEIFVLLSGTSNYFLNDSVYSLTPGCIVFIAPDDLHYNQYTSDWYERYTLNFPADFLPNEVMPMVDRLYDKRILSSDPSWCRKIFDDMAKERETNDEFSEIMIKNHLIYLFTSLSRTNHVNPDANVNSIHPAISKAVDYINEHYFEDITLESVAKTINFNSSYLSRLFHRSIGIPFKQYLMFVRIEKASKILSVDFEKTIHETAYECGFNDSNYFSMIFKRFKNYTPVEYRKMKMQSSKRNITLT